MQRRLPAVGEVLKDVLNGIGASTDEASDPVRNTSGDPDIPSPHRPPSIPGPPERTDHFFLPG